MPTYSYRCNHCGHILEAFQNMSDPLLKECPSCRGETLERVLFSAPGFALKGSGWYKTDYAKDNKAAVATSAAEMTAETKPAVSADHSKKDNHD